MRSVKGKNLQSQRKMAQVQYKNMDLPLVAVKRKCKKKKPPTFIPICKRKRTFIRLFNFGICKKKMVLSFNELPIN